MADCRPSARNSTSSRDSYKCSQRNSCRTQTHPNLTYTQWRARRLLPLDVQFLLYFILTHMVYGVKTAKHLAARGFYQTHAASGVSPGRLQGVYCISDATSNSSSVLGWCYQVPLLRQLLQVLVNGFKVLLNPLFCSSSLRDFGILSSCLSIAVWTAVLLLPPLQQKYVHQPSGTLRTAVLLLQRFAKLAGTAASLGVVQQQYIDLSMVGYFLTVGQYLFSGWQAAMTPIPFKLQVTAGLLEWLIICYIISAAKTTYPIAAAAIMRHSTASLWTLCFILAYLIPTSVNYCIERSHKRSYAEYSAGYHGRVWESRTVFNPTGDNSSSSSSNGGTLSSSGAAFTDELNLTNSNSSGSNKMGMTKSLNQSEDAAAAAAEDVPPQAVHGSSITSTTTSTAAAAGAAADALMSKLQPQLAALLGPRDAEELAATVIRSSGNGLRMNDHRVMSYIALSPACGQPGSADKYTNDDKYTAMCSRTQVSIKVHGIGQYEVATVGPTLHSSLLQSIISNGSSSSSAAVHSVCFEGCVQLLALLYRPTSYHREPGTHKPGSSSSSSSSCCTKTSKDAAAAATSLLQGVQTTLTAYAAAESAADAMQSEQIAVDVLWDDAFISSATGKQQQQCCSAKDCHPVRLCVVTPGAAGNRSGLMLGQPCLVSGQMASLGFSLPGLSSLHPDSQTAAISSSCSAMRLLVFQQQHILVDQVIRLKPLVTVQIPPAAAGVAHMVLVPLRVPVQQQLSSVITFPLMVLPAAAASELRHLHDATTTKPESRSVPAHGDDADSKIEQLTTKQDEHLNSTFAGLSTDVAYLFGSVSSCSNDKTAGRPLTAEQTNVLKHVLVFLAQNSCWETMRFVVEAVQLLMTTAPSDTGLALAVSLRGLGQG